MKQSLIILAVLSVPFLFLAAEGSGEGIETGGFLEMDKHLNISDGVSNGDTYGRLRFEAKSDLSVDVFSLISLEIRYYDFPELNDLPPVDTIESDYPVDFLFREAYLEITRLVLDNLDVKIGRQRIAWGTADKFNPTDNLNPDDLTDFLDFGAKTPSLALKGDYYLGDYTVTGVWMPVFEPALFRRGGIRSLLGRTPDRIDLPARNLQNGSFALKLSGVALNLDYSMSYFNGFDDIPIEVNDSGGTKMGYPEMQALGFDFAGEFRSVGLWGEMALFYPEEIRSGPEIVLSGNPYLKYTFGMDYTFRNSTYLEIQYVHGFTTERGSGNLHDYLMGTLERKFPNDDLKLSLAGALEVKEIGRNIKDSYGTGVFPEISYHPADNLKITAGAFLLDGRIGTLFGGWKDRDQLYLKTRIDF
ncbi:MAG: hypothetical protein GXP46_12145 [Deferribacteres bacterium]|nr:hypothetical protein [Deferribacteres bacterium]